MDLKQLLDETAHAGPAHPPVAERVAAGRRAVRRARASTALAVAAVVGVTGIAWSVLADQPDSTVASSAEPEPPAPPIWPSDDSWAAINEDGEVSLRSGVEVRQRFDGVVPGLPSVALDLVRGEEHRFVQLWMTGNGVVSEVVEPGIGALNEFVVANQGIVDGDLPVAVGTGGDYASLPLVAYRNSQLWVVPGAEIVTVVTEPIPGWCGAWPSHAVEIAYEGERYFAALTEGNCGGTFGQATPDRTIEDFIADFASVQP